ncbi:hypothetical protein AB433_05380 [Croceicoccus naphthovorans]|uniref:TonB C-terminal domain-containing protein n=1 Tax=Croceicoccus naphthovorans TaxID=1348774 RepID=A0A0G3XK54_9SPHN|nr:hypothetical protein AB433_05380 [Croceicoccus naphthovorans]
MPNAVKETITAISLELTPEPDPPPPEKVEEVEPEGASGAEAARAKPKEVSAPPPKIVIKDPPPAPPVSSDGDENRSGAAEQGAGTGGGGPGVGTGSGGEGTGSGGVAYQRRAEKVAGEIRAKDYPRSSVEQRDGAYVIVHFTVTAGGRATGCRVARSSGNAEVDRITCQLVEQRFRYRPAIDGNGNPTSEKVGWKQWWWQ